MVDTLTRNFVGTLDINHSGAKTQFKSVMPYICNAAQIYFRKLSEGGRIIIPSHKNGEGEPWVPCQIEIFQNIVY